MLPTGLVVVLALRRAARLTALGAPGRRFWKLLTAAMTLNLAGNIVQVVAHLGPLHRFAGLPPLLWLGTTIVGVWAVLTIPIETRARHELVRLWLDAATVLLASGVLLWYFVVAPGLGGRADLRELLMSLVLPAAFLVVVFGVTRVLLGRSADVHPRSLALLAAAAVVGAVSQVLVPYMGRVPLAFTLLPVSQFITATAAWVQYRAMTTGRPPLERSKRRPFSLLPYGAVAAGCGVLVIALADVVDQRTAIVVATVPALVAVVVARQVIALRDNADLLDRLDANLTELKAAWDREREATAARVALEVELRHAHKLEAVGRLAAGVAHEINTPIQFISDNTRFLGDAFDQVGRLLRAYRDALAGDPRTWPERKAVLAAAEEAADLDFLLQEAPAAARQTLDGAEEAGRIVQAMKAFGHPDSSLQEPADLNEALRTTITIARGQLEPAEVRTELGELPLVTCYPSDLNQVFLNLLVNAADAVAERGEPGSVAVRTRADGEHVEIVVADTGIGIPDEIRGRIFDPFFTTKPVGQGSGQGLSVVHAIVIDRHNGTIAVDSEVGQGTTITVRLPVTGAADQAGEPLERSTQPVSR